MNRSIIIAGVVISAAILLNGYFDRAARAPHAAKPPEKQPSMVPEKTIAVLPFQDLSSEQNAGFADGIQQEIINRLTKVHDLKVASAEAVKGYQPAERDLRQVAGELGVANLLKGSVQHAANRVRVVVQLVDARTDTHLWVERYDYELTDLFVIEREIAKAVVGQLGTRLSRAEEAAIAAGGSQP
jgi:TolB-like protein